MSTGSNADSPKPKTVLYLAQDDLKEEYQNNTEAITKYCSTTKRIGHTTHMYVDVNEQKDGTVRIKVEAYPLQTLAKTVQYLIKEFCKVKCWAKYTIPDAKKANDQISVQKQKQLQAGGEYCPPLSEEALKCHDLESSCELRQFRRPQCKVPWWKTVPKYKPVSKCHRCKLCLNPLTRLEQFGTGRFTCICGNVFFSNCQGSDARPCRSCGRIIRRPYIHPHFRVNDGWQVPFNDQQPPPGTSKPSTASGVEYPPSPFHYDYAGPNAPWDLSYDLPRPRRRHTFGDHIYVNITETGLVLNRPVPVRISGSGWPNATSLLGCQPPGLHHSMRDIRPPSLPQECSIDHRTVSKYHGCLDEPHMPDYNPYETTTIPSHCNDQVGSTVSKVHMQAIPVSGDIPSPAITQPIEKELLNTPSVPSPLTNPSCTPAEASPVLKPKSVPNINQEGKSPLDVNSKTQSDVDFQNHHPPQEQKPQHHDPTKSPSQPQPNENLFPDETNDKMGELSLSISPQTVSTPTVKEQVSSTSDQTICTQQHGSEYVPPNTTLIQSQGPQLQPNDTTESQPQSETVSTSSNINTEDDKTVTGTVTPSITTTTSTTSLPLQKYTGYPNTNRNITNDSAQALAPTTSSPHTTCTNRPAVTVPSISTNTGDQLTSDGHGQASNYPYTDQYGNPVPQSKIRPFRKDPRHLPYKQVSTEHKCTGTTQSSIAPQHYDCWTTNRIKPHHHAYRDRPRMPQYDFEETNDTGEEGHSVE